MKKLFLFVIMSVMAITVSAQIRSVDVRGNFRERFGIGIGATVELSERIDVAPSFNHYFIKDAHAWSIDGDFHYNLPLESDFVFYPILGLSFYDQGGKELSNKSRLGISGGCGIRYEVVDRVSLFGEAKYHWLNKMDNVFLAVGVNFGI